MIRLHGTTTSRISGRRARQIRTGPGEVMSDDRTVRGGRQRIPRPERILHGPPPPWADLSPAERHFDLATLRRRFSDLGPAVRSPREPLTDLASAVLAGLYAHEDDLWVVLARRSES